MSRPRWWWLVSDEHGVTMGQFSWRKEADAFKRGHSTWKVRKVLR